LGPADDTWAFFTALILGGGAITELRAPLVAPKARCSAVLLLDAALTGTFRR